MKTLRLVRDVPGPTEQTRETGGVAEAVVYSDGRAVLHWLTEPRGTELYDSEADMRAVREASGRSRFTETGKLNLPLAGTGNLRDRLRGLREVQAGWAFGVPEDGQEHWLDAVAAVARPPARPDSTVLGQLQDAAGDLVREAGSWTPGEDGRLSQEPVIAETRALIARAHAAGASGIAGEVNDLLSDYRDDLISLGPFLGKLADLAWNTRAPAEASVQETAS
jgi:hypothetical protein